jgi:hypothetical protein
MPDGAAAQRCIVASFAATSRGTASGAIANGDPCSDANTGSASDDVADHCYIFDPTVYFLLEFSGAFSSTTLDARPYPNQPRSLRFRPCLWHDHAAPLGWEDEAGKRNGNGSGTRDRHSACILDPTLRSLEYG